MDLKDDIVLLECRFFQDLLTVYFYHIGDETLKDQMTNGACNKIAGKIGNPNNTAMSIANFKEIIKIPEIKFQGGSSNIKNIKNIKNKTKKHKKLKNKKHKKTKRNKNKKSSKSKSKTMKN